MVLGLLASLILVIYHSSRPHMAILGRLPGITDAYVDLKRHPESIAVPGVLIFRLDAPLYYANALTVRDQIKELIEASETPTRAVLFDAVTQDSLDLTSAEMLMGLVKEFNNQGIGVYVAGVHAPVIEFSRKVGLLDLIGEKNVFPTVDAAVRFIEISDQAGTKAK
jgi:SulP family sulfate permease